MFLLKENLIVVSGDGSLKWNQFPCHLELRITYTDLVPTKNFHLFNLIPFSEI